ncbi:MAG: hypothetical protein PUD79_06000 [Prevotellaceae bacterium]|nr:hypothetical protein [Prevotellaceae bacterium]
MKRVLSLLAMALLVFGVVKAEVTFPEFSTGTNDIKYYRIKNMRSGKYASYQTDSKVMLQTKNTDMRTLFYFKDAKDNLPNGVKLEDGVKAVYIFNAATPTRLNSYDYNWSTWTYNGNIYYIQEYTKGNYTGVVISTSQDVSKYGAWNDYGQTTICNYVANDAGSIWEFESADVSNPLTLIPEVVMSTEESKKYYTIRNIDCNKYAEGQAENEVIKLETNRSFGCWKFVEAPQGAGEGVKACYIYNVNLGKYLNEFYNSSGVATYSETTEGATVYYLTPVNKTFNIYSYNGWFISKSKNIGDYSGWNRQGSSTKVGNWNCDHGSVFDISEILSATEEYNLNMAKKSEVSKSCNAYLQADYYAFPSGEVNALKTAIDNSNIVDNGDIETNYKELNKLVVARNKLASSPSKTGTPTSGDFIRLLNRNYNKYLNHTLGATSFNAVTDKNDSTLWQLNGDVENGFSLKNVATGKYIGSQDTTSYAFPVSDKEVKFEFSNPAECYAAFRVHGSTKDHAYAHINGNLVCWNNSAVASQWVVSVEVSWQEVLNSYNELKVLYGASSSQINLPMAETFFDTYKSAPTTATLYTDLIAMSKQMEAIRSLKPGYYYIRSYSNGRYVNCAKKDASEVETQERADKNAIFYLDSENNLMAYENGAYWKGVYRLGVGSFTSNGTNYIYKHPWTIAIGKYDGTFSLQYGNDTEGRYYATANGNATSYAGDATSDAAMWYLDPVESLPLSVSSVKYATFASAVDVIIPEGVKVYYAPETSSESTIQLVEVTGNIPANTGVIVYAEIAKEYNFKITSGVSALGTNYLKPAVEAQSIIPQNGYSAYIFANKNTNGVGFYRLNSGSNEISGHKCWLELSTSSPSNSFFGFGFDEDDLTAVESVDLIVSDDNNIVYDLQGNVVVNTVKGRLYIKNGRVFKAN